MTSRHIWCICAHSRPFQLIRRFYDESLGLNFNNVVGVVLFQWVKVQSWFVVYITLFRSVCGYYCGNIHILWKYPRSVDIICISWKYPCSVDIIHILCIYLYFVEISTWCAYYLPSCKYPRSVDIICILCVYPYFV